MKEMAREKGKWKSQRWLGMQDFSIFARQMPYFVIVNLSTKKVDITVGQLVAMFPTIRWDLWRRLSAHCIKALYEKKGPFGGSWIWFMCIISGSGSPWNTFEGYFNGWRSWNKCYDSFHNGNFGVAMWRPIKCSLRMVNKKRVKPERVITTINISVLRVTTTLDFQLIRSKIGAYPLILGRPWLKKAHASNYWKEGYMTIGVSPIDNEFLWIEGKI